MNQEASITTDHADEPHGVKIGVFLKVFAALCVLTAISFGVANSPLMNSKLVGWLMMMVVSCAKAFLVISFFMHLRWEQSWKYVLTIPTLIMGVLLVVALVPDIAMRTAAYSENRWLHATEGASPAASSDGSHAESAHADAPHAEAGADAATTEPDSSETNEAASNQ